MTEVKGLEALRRRWAAIPAKVQEALQEQLEANAADLAAAVQRAAPVKSGTLRDSVRVEPGPKPLSIRVVVGGAATRRQAGTSRKGGYSYDYALAVEYGHKDGSVHVPAQPFFWPAYRARKKLFKRRLQAAARKAIKSLEG
jgi:HK97 gp10 family phage protein